MSRSNPTLTNPAQRFYEWKGGSGDLIWYDKEQKQNFTMDLPFDFLVLDELATITGFSDADQSSFWSNEVRSTVTEELSVKTSKGVRYVGKYKNEQGMVQVPAGARYARSVYIIHQINGIWTMANIKFYGAALTAWITFSSQHKVENGKVTLTGAEEGKKGTTVYQIPTFEYSSATDSENQTAIDFDRQLQAYLDRYLTTPKDEPIDESDSEEVIDPAIGIASEEEIADYKERKTAQKSASKRDWNSIGKSKKDDQVDAEAESLYAMIAEAEQIPLDEQPFPS